MVVATVMEISDGADAFDMAWACGRSRGDVSKMIAAATPNPTLFLIAFACGSLLPILLGGYCVWRGVRGVMEGVFPFSSNQDIEGIMARIFGGFMAVCGLFFICSGVGTILFCIWRIAELSRG